ncbi:hypothetical protein F383_21850 [Gossypium arboreum]|uniref:Uncharacterized protein n=1 Tax=Gossypium arboreum TaxID=29729 RepID=A0A0B0P1J9_GOSAR|nr:hypothetical protein F383_21850 [Gossypium arboreum]
MERLPNELMYLNESVIKLAQIRESSATHSHYRTSILVPF